MVAKSMQQGLRFHAEKDSKLPAYNFAHTAIYRALTSTCTANQTICYVE
jgi:hypothetical protein